MAARFAVAFLIAVLAAGADPAAAQTPSPDLTPRQLLARTFQRLQSYPVADYAVWIDTFKAQRTGPGDQHVSDVSLVRYAVRMSDGMENYTPFPVSGTTLPIARVGPEFLGPFAFSLRREQPPNRPGSALHPDVPGSLKTIATVVAYAAPYAIDLAGIENLSATSTGTESVAGHRVYHLRMRALNDPQRHNLRDLWIDVDTFDLWKAHFVGTYRPDPTMMESPTEVTVVFAPVASYWVVSHATWTWEDYETPAHLVFDATTDFITFPSALPDWLFDQRDYGRHMDAKEPDVLDSVVAKPSPSPSPARSSRPSLPFPF